MTTTQPPAELDRRFSAEDATPTPWHEASSVLDKSEVFWLSTVRADGRPHVTPLLAVWVDRSMFFCTGPTEQKARNLEHDQRCVLTTGGSGLASGLDLVVEGTAVRVTDGARLRRIADRYASKYGPDWAFTVGDGVFNPPGDPDEDEGPGPGYVFEVAPVKVLAFRKGDYSQTRWRFDRG